jgi:hypothetical protein
MKLHYAETRTTPPYNFSVRVPASWVGPLELQAIAETATGFATSAPAAVSVVPPAPLTAVELSLGSDVMSERNQTTRAIVHGVSAGRRYRLPLSPGHTFTSSNTAVATVDAMGFVKARGPGLATISVQADALRGTAQLRVNETADDQRQTNISRISNLSLLTAVSGAEDAFTMGFVVGGEGTAGAKPLLLRASGPSLTPLGVPGVHQDPKLQVFSGAALVDENDNWGGIPAISAAMAGVGAFPFAATSSRDAALLRSITSKDNSIRVAGVGNSAGAVLAEIYDTTPSAQFGWSTPRLLNVSVLKQIGSGFTAGFVIAGDGLKTVLIRAVGPALGQAPFNVGGVVANPRIVLLGEGARVIRENDDWGGQPELSLAFATVGAFALPASSRDAALQATVEPGNYTIQVTGNGAGLVLLEIYELR